MWIEIIASDVQHIVRVLTADEEFRIEFINAAAKVIFEISS